MSELGYKIWKYLSNSSSSRFHTHVCTYLPCKKLTQDHIHFCNVHHVHFCNFIYPRQKKFPLHDGAPRWSDMTFYFHNKLMQVWTLSQTFPPLDTTRYEFRKNIAYDC